jgi:hypothetical protein
MVWNIVSVGSITTTVFINTYDVYTSYPYPRIVRKPKPTKIKKETLVRF